ncbi:MAG: prepilin-type N-terminal cleavage/methylation domain-containing protein [Elusimicrobiaceae bacterium]|nr:prepilin-type N-terminal cleavage/methylation domain-containing protein [Elusimicrobiaceae bacterium]
MNKAFTLVELLVVVLIIGVLSAIAIPMYQGAVDKSHWSTMLPGAKAIKDAEEAIKMTNGAYTDEMANLDVTMNNADLTFALVTPNNTADPNVIRVTNSKLANVRLASYLDDNPKFAGQLHCEAKTGDERAERLCGKLLMGQELTSADGYTGYLLDQAVDESTCQTANRSWSSSQTKCYKDTATRCQALGMNDISGTANMTDQCGYTNELNRKEIGEEGICYANSKWGCFKSTVTEGGICIGEGSDLEQCGESILNGGTCIAKGWNCTGVDINEGGLCKAIGLGGCSANWEKRTVINNGGVCEVDVSNGAYGCTSVIVNDGGKCIAPNGPTAWGYSCTGTYNGTGCCEGAGCPPYAPKC